MDDDLVRQQNERLLLAAKNGNLSVVNDALEHGALINTEDTVRAPLVRPWPCAAAGVRAVTGLHRAALAPARLGSAVAVSNVRAALVLRD